MSSKQDIRFTVNGKNVSVSGNGMKRLLDVIREDLSLTGTKEGCGEGECGACAILLDGKLVNSCLIPVLQVEDQQIVTIEAIEQNPQLRSLQDKMIEKGGIQCGMCTPGMIMAGAALLETKNISNLNLIQTEQCVRQAISGNLCRCTGYSKIIESFSDCLSEVK